MSILKIAPGYAYKQAFEIVAKWNTFPIAITEDSSAAIPTLVISETQVYYGFTAIACAMVRNSKSQDKKWAKTVLADGNAENSALIEQFISMAESIYNGTSGEIKALVGQIQNYIKPRTFLVGDGITIADVLLYLVFYDSCFNMSPKERSDFCDVCRWLDQVHFLIASPYKQFEFPLNAYNHPGKKAAGAQPQKGAEGAKKQQNQNQNKNQAPKEKKPSKPAAPKAQVVDNRDAFSFVDIRVGQITKVWFHPGADTLYREEIDVGNGEIKQVVTGVRNFVPIEEMQNRKVVVFCNIKPSKIRGEPSEAMVFAASDASHEHVELLNPPADTPVGTRVVCGSFVEGEVPGVDTKGKYWKAVSEAGNLTVNDAGLACYKGVPLSLPQGNITVPTLRSCEFH